MNSGTAEFYLIVGYMTLVLIIAFTAVYIFIRQYKREMKKKNEAKNPAKNAAAEKK